MRKQRNRKLPKGRELRLERRAHDRLVNHKYDPKTSVSQVPSLYDFIMQNKPKLKL